MKTRLIAAAALVAASTWVAIPMDVQAATIVVRTAPPAPIYEPVPPPRVGYQWAPGHYDWRDNRYVWARGNWVQERPGYVYSAPTWVERNGQWERHEERWARRDADHDGIPNGADHHPENPNRR